MWITTQRILTAPHVVVVPRNVVAIEFQADLPWENMNLNVIQLTIVQEILSRGMLLDYWEIIPNVCLQEIVLVAQRYKIHQNKYTKLK